jgi:hypothetical protein
LARGGQGRKIFKNFLQVGHFYPRLLRFESRSFLPSPPSPALEIFDSKGGGAGTVDLKFFFSSWSLLSSSPALQISGSTGVGTEDFQENFFLQVGHFYPPSPALEIFEGEGIVTEYFSGIFFIKSLYKRFGHAPKKQPFQRPEYLQNPRKTSFLQPFILAYPQRARWKKEV